MKIKALLLTACLTITSAVMAIAPFEPSNTVRTVGTQNAKIASTTSTKITNLSQQINRSLSTQTSALSNAIRGAVAQEAVSATQIATADRNARIVQSEAKNASEIAQKTIDVKLNYGPETGQGYAACKVLEENKEMAGAVLSVAQDAPERALAVDNAAGSLVRSRLDAANARAAHHKDNFCTSEEVENKDCDEVSDTPGLDSDASVLFTSAQPGTKVAAAKQALRQNILGSPDVAIPAPMGQTANGQAYLYNLNRKAALTAFPAYSLAYQESMTEKRDSLKDAKGNPMSPNDLLFATVSRYYGSDDAKEWQKSMVKQMPRGLLVELAKMEGLGAWLDNQEYMANMRIEGNIASMTVTTTLPMEEQLARERQTLARSKTASDIKNSQ